MGVLLLFLFQVWPSCPAEGWVTSEYGYRHHPILSRRSFHRGIDIANKEGTEVRSPWNGRVEKVRRTRGHGLHVVVVSGPLRVVLSHLSEALVSEGDAVPKGSVVGLMGHTGRATGDHLHLEVQVPFRRAVDPSFALVGCPVLD